MYNYFPWPSNMRTADRVLELRMNEGSAGYGIYVMVLELLRDAEERRVLFNPKKIAYAINEVDSSLVERVIKDYGLFTQTPDNYIKSDWLDSQLSEFDSRKETAREAGRRGAAKRWGNRVEEKSAEDRVPNSTPLATLSDPNSNITNITKDNIIKPTKSKLANLEFEEYSGEDLISLARKNQQPVGDNARRWAGDTQKMLDAQEGAGKYNLDALLEVCDHYRLGEDMFSFLLKYTNLAQVGHPGLVKLMSIYMANKKEKFEPKYPAEYLLVKLLETNGITK